MRIFVRLSKGDFVEPQSLSVLESDVRSSLKVEKA